MAVFDTVGGGEGDGGTHEHVYKAASEKLINLMKRTSAGN
jgi:hypothetical protein